MKRACHIVMLLAGIISLPAAAAAMFDDHFDSFSNTSVLNVQGMQGWSTTSGTVDYIRNGDVWGISCGGGSGGCIDLDGSTNKGGRFQGGGDGFSFVAGKTYALTASLSGNQRGGADDNVLFGISAGGTDLFSQSIENLAWDAVFQTYTLSFTATFDFVGNIFFNDLGGDSIGAVLDDVSLSSLDFLLAAGDTVPNQSNETGGGQNFPAGQNPPLLASGSGSNNPGSGRNQVPEPVSLSLLAIGALALLTRRPR